MDRIEIDSNPPSAVITTGRLTTAPIPRIPTCGWFRIGVSNKAPRLPVFVRVKVPGPRRDVRDAAREPDDVEVTGGLDDRDEEAALGVDGDTEMDGFSEGDLTCVDVDRRIEHRVSG